MTQDDMASRMEAARRYNDNMDARLRDTGVVSPKLFVQFGAVESDPNASSVGWLEGKLAVLADRIRAGKGVSVCDPQRGKSVPITDIQELVDWASRNFPVVDFKG